MAITQNSNGNSRRRVDEGIKPSCLKSPEAGPCDTSRCSDKGPSTGKQRLIRGLFKSCNLIKKRKKDDEDSHSDIDDAEVVGYLNTKEEINYKRILWEAINPKYTEAKKPKQTTETKKCVSVKKAAKTTEKVEFRKTSSRVNYDALKLLDDELNQGYGAVGADSSYAHRTEDSRYGNTSRHESDEGNNYDEDQHDIGYNDDDYEYEDEHLECDFF